MPQRRARRCSASAAPARRVMSSRSQLPSPPAGAPSVVLEALEVNHPIAFLYLQFDQSAASARALEAAAARGVVHRAVRAAHEVATGGIEKYSFLPVELHRDMRAAVEVGVRRA